MYREEFPSCPACDGKLDPVGTRLRCGSCEGVFVGTSELDELFASMSPDDARTTSARLTDRAGDRRRCPTCRMEMRTATLMEIAVDVCAEHGVWFDANELAWVLEIDGRDFAMRTDPERARRTRGRPPEVRRAGAPEPPPLVRTFWQKLFGSSR